jgi:hypothetical protein
MRTSFFTVLAIAGLVAAAPCPQPDNALSIGSGNSGNSILSDILSPSIGNGNGNGNQINGNGANNIAGSIVGNDGNQASAGNGNSAQSNSAFSFSSFHKLPMS